MTYRERFARTLTHQSVDRPPMDLGATDMTEIEGGPRRLAGLLGVAHSDEAVLRALDIDVRGVGGVLTPRRSLARRISDSEFVDAWGIRYAFTGVHVEAVGRPLAGASIADLERYPWPDPDTLDPDELAGLAEEARRLSTDTPYVVCGRHPVLGVMELGCWMCGFDDFLYRMAAEPEFVHRFFEIVLAYQKRVIEQYYGAIGRWLHFTTSGDDFGTQAAPFVSPAMFRRLVSPYMEERIAYMRRYTDAAFFHHSCGAVAPLIPELIRIGVDILNPIQPTAQGMDAATLQRDFGGVVTFYGGIDTQRLLPRGTPEHVGSETLRIVDILGRSGGYILSPAHVILSEVPDANVLAMYGAGVESRE